MLDIFDFYDKMERNNIMLSFKGNITSELLTSVLQIMESKLENLDEPPAVKKKVYNVLVECLQNLYHHTDEMATQEEMQEENLSKRAAIFMIGKVDDSYRIITGNYMLKKNIEILKGKIDHVNSLDKEQLKSYYKEILNNGTMSSKGGGGLGIIDIARKSGQKLHYDFMEVNDTFSFFTLNINIANNKNLNYGCNKD